jgi:serine protease Do
VRIGARRGGKDVEFEVELVDELAPYDRPFLGILPAPLALDTKAPPPGVEVRWVFPESPAAAAGVTAGDRIVKFAGQEVNDRKALNQAIEALPVGESVPLTVARNGQPVELNVTLAKLPIVVPAEMPQRPSLAGEKPKDLPPTGTIEPKLPEFENKITAYVPADYDPRRAYGLVIWLHPAGDPEAAKMLERWKPLCDQHQLILLAPSAKDPKRWDPAETAMLRRAAMQIVGQYNIDRNRVAVVGQGGGGAMAWLLTLSARGLVRGVAPLDAALPLGTEAPQTEPAAPLAIYAAWPAQSSLALRIAKGLDELRKQQFPVSTRSLGDKPRPLDDAELAELARWIDALDRI